MLDWPFAQQEGGSIYVMLIPMLAIIFLMWWAGNQRQRARLRPNMLEWRYSLTIPMAEKPHEVIFAFLRTSEWGEWELAGPLRDAFVLEFSRGERAYQREAFGLLWKRDVAPVVDESTPAKEIRMALRVTLRPAPSAVTINLYHSASFCVDRKHLASVQERIGKHVEGEVRALACYLRECFGLPEVPKIEVGG